MCYTDVIIYIVFFSSSIRWSVYAFCKLWCFTHPRKTIYNNNLSYYDPRSIIRPSVSLPKIFFFLIHRRPKVYCKKSYYYTCTVLYTYIFYFWKYDKSMFANVLYFETKCCSTRSYCQENIFWSRPSNLIC